MRSRGGVELMHRRYSMPEIVMRKYRLSKRGTEVSESPEMGVGVDNWCQTSPTGEAQILIIATPSPPGRSRSFPEALSSSSSAGGRVYFRPASADRILCSSSGGTPSPGAPTTTLSQSVTDRTASTQDSTLSVLSSATPPKPTLPSPPPPIVESETSHLGLDLVESRKNYRFALSGSSEDSGTGDSDTGEAKEEETGSTRSTIQPAGGPSHKGTNTTPGEYRPTNLQEYFLGISVACQTSAGRREQDRTDFLESQLFERQGGCESDGGVEEAPRGQDYNQNYFQGFRVLPRVAAPTGNYEEFPGLERAVPRYWAIPRTGSMLVNTSSVDGECTSGSSSIISEDSLEEEPVCDHRLRYPPTRHDDRPVRGEVNTREEINTRKKYIKSKNTYAYFLFLSGEEDTIREYGLPDKLRTRLRRKEEEIKKHFEAKFADSLNKKPLYRKRKKLKSYFRANSDTTNSSQCRTAKGRQVDDGLNKSTQCSDDRESPKKSGQCGSSGKCGSTDVGKGVGEEKVHLASDKKDTCEDARTCVAKQASRESDEDKRIARLLMASLDVRDNAPEEIGSGRKWCLFDMDRDVAFKVIAENDKFLELGQPGEINKEKNDNEEAKCRSESVKLTKNDSLEKAIKENSCVTVSPKTETSVVSFNTVSTGVQTSESPIEKRPDSADFVIEKTEEPVLIPESLGVEPGTLCGTDEGCPPHNSLEQFDIDFHDSISTGVQTSPTQEGNPEHPNDNESFLPLTSTCLDSENDEATRKETDVIDVNRESVWARANSPGSCVNSPVSISTWVQTWGPLDEGEPNRNNNEELNDECQFMNRSVQCSPDILGALSKIDAGTSCELNRSNLDDHARSAISNSTQCGKDDRFLDCWKKDELSKSVQVPSASVEGSSSSSSSSPDATVPDIIIEDISDFSPDDSASRSSDMIIENEKNTMDLLNYLSPTTETPDAVNKSNTKAKSRRPRADVLEINAVSCRCHMCTLERMAAEGATTPRRNRSTSGIAEEKRHNKDKEVGKKTSRHAPTAGRHPQKRYTHKFEVIPEEKNTLAESPLKEGQNTPLDLSPHWRRQSHPDGNSVVTSPEQARVAEKTEIVENNTAKVIEEEDRAGGKTEDPPTQKELQRKKQTSARTQLRARNQQPPKPATNRAQHKKPPFVIGRFKRVKDKTETNQGKDAVPLNKKGSDGETNECQPQEEFEGQEELLTLSKGWINFYLVKDNKDLSENSTMSDESLKKIDTKPAAKLKAEGSPTSCTKVCEDPEMVHQYQIEIGALPVPDAQRPSSFLPDVNSAAKRETAEPFRKLVVAQQVQPDGKAPTRLPKLNNRRTATNIKMLSSDEEEVETPPSTPNRGGEMSSSDSWREQPSQLENRRQLPQSKLEADRNKLAHSRVVRDNRRLPPGKSTSGGNSWTVTIAGSSSDPNQPPPDVEMRLMFQKDHNNRAANITKQQFGTSTINPQQIESAAIGHDETDSASLASYRANINTRKRQQSNMLETSNLAKKEKGQRKLNADTLLKAASDYPQAECKHSTIQSRGFCRSCSREQTLTGSWSSDSCGAPLSVTGTSITPETKPRVPTQTERDLVRAHRAAKPS